ncbi:hydrolase [Clostridium botulinum]|nr:hydrolase [Clostridium botulinum]
MSNQEFLNKIIPGAQKGYRQYGIFASVTIAQAIEESGWGASNVAKTDNNLYGIQWSGAKDPSLNIMQGTIVGDGAGKGKTCYRRYTDWNSSTQDHAYFLKNNSIYTDAGIFNAKTPQEQIKAIKSAGYAENSNYVSNIMQIIKDNNLIQYDTGTYTGGDSANSQSEMLTIESTNYEITKGSEKEGDSLFGRRYRITVSDNQGNALDISQLHCLFEITKTIQMEPNLSIITVYNLNVKTENAIIASGKRVTVEAGYEGSQFGLIFDGDIIQCINSRDDGTTCKLEIIALDSDRAINFDIVNFSIVRGQTQRDIVNHMSNTASNSINLGSISEKLNGQKLSRGKVVFGKASDYYRQIAKSNDLQFYMDDGSLNLISMGDLPEGEIFDLSPKSGLVGTPEQSDYGVNGKCLLNPQIKLNSLIHVDNKLVRAKRIDINGSNTTPIGGVSINNVAGVRNKIIAEAKQICDDPNVGYSRDYRGQTVGGKTYWDCSSFAKHCYEVAGLSIVDITGPQYNQVSNEGGKFISQSEALPADLVFWGKGDACHHVAIYAGDGYVYAARGSDGKKLADQVAYHALYGEPEFARPKCLIDADKGQMPNCSSNNNINSDKISQGLFRALDKDGIYRVIKIQYIGDTRGNDWYLNFDTIDQLGGAIAAVSN